MAEYPRSVRAVTRAREVVGFYGDPQSNWGIGLELSLDRSLDGDALAGGVDRLLHQHPHLGGEAHVESVPPAAWERMRLSLLCREYAASDPLVRVAVVPDEGKLLVATHHGVCDGLGLVALASALSGTTIRTQAPGIGDRRAHLGFFRYSAKRFTEAMVRVPPRFPSTGPARSAARSDHPATLETENVVIRHLPLLRRGTADLAWSVGQVFAGRGGRGVPLVSIGASRRISDMPEPDRQTAYFRLRVPRGFTRAALRSHLAERTPEPDFPETDLRGLAPALVRLVRNRLGATAAISNLGVLDGPGVRDAAMFPALSGPRAVVLGMASTSSTTTLTLRTRSADFAPHEAANVLDEVTAALSGDSQ